MNEYDKEKRLRRIEVDITIFKVILILVIAMTSYLFWHILNVLDAQVVFNEQALRVIQRLAGH